jgi:TonB family protein
MYTWKDPGVIPALPVKELKPAQPVIDSSTQRKPTVTHGAVALAILIGVDGIVHDVKVVAPLDPVLDAEAVEAVKRWGFLPGRKFGLPVPTQANTEVIFKRD